MKYPQITIELLKSKNAPKYQIDLFQNTFGDKPAPLNKKVFTKLANHFDIEWAAKNLLDRKDSAEYNKATGPAWSKYRKVVAPAWAEYEKVADAALSVYKASTTNPDWREYTKVTDPAYAEYNKVAGPAWTEYGNATALIFLKIYKAS